MSRLLYLHGFASGPASKKARIFRDRFADAGIQLNVPDLAAGDFENLTITAQLGVVEREAGGGPVRLIGSSMGGYLAALYASRHPETERMVLLAPAFDFVRRWQERSRPCPARTSPWGRRLRPCGHPATSSGPRSPTRPRSTT